MSDTIKKLTAILTKWDFGLELPVGLDGATTETFICAVLTLRVIAPADHPCRKAINYFLALDQDSQSLLASTFVAGLMAQVAAIDPDMAKNIRFRIMHTLFSYCRSEEDQPGGVQSGEDQPGEVQSGEDQPKGVQAKFWESNPMSTRCAIEYAYNLGAITMPEKMRHLDSYWDKLYGAQSRSWYPEPAELEGMLSTMLELTPELKGLTA